MKKVTKAQFQAALDGYHSIQRHYLGGILDENLRAWPHASKRFDEVLEEVKSLIPNLNGHCLKDSYLMEQANTLEEKINRIKSRYNELLGSEPDNIIQFPLAS